MIKYYKIISNVNRELSDDKSLYWTPADSDCKGYTCKQLPINPDFQDEVYTKDSKFGALFAAHVDADIEFSKAGDSYTKFSLQDGSTWAISFAEGTPNVEFMIDINGEGNPPDCLFEFGCRNKVDRFCFAIPTTGGQVVGNDPLTVAYLKNSIKLNNKKKDYSAAKADKTIYSYRESAMQ